MSKATEIIASGIEYRDADKARDSDMYVYDLAKAHAQTALHSAIGTRFIFSDGSDITVNPWADYA